MSELQALEALQDIAGNLGGVTLTIASACRPRSSCGTLLSRRTRLPVQERLLDDPPPSMSSPGVTPPAVKPTDPKSRWGFSLCSCPSNISNESASCINLSIRPSTN